MTESIAIVELTTEDEYREAFPVMRELRTHLDEAAFLDLTGTMRRDGYRLFALRDDSGAIVALSGVAVCLNLYHLRHLWVYDLVTTAAGRSRGYGRRLLAHMDTVARAEGCGSVVLASGVQRTDAHRFYEKHMGYARVSHIFRKVLV